LYNKAFIISHLYLGDLKMLKKVFFLSFIILLNFAFIKAQSTAPVPAKSILTQAYAASDTSGKNIFLIFHASWCSWCKRLEKAMTSDELKPIFEKYFVITHLDIMERGEKVALLENPGGKEFMEKMGGAKSGLPFYVTLTGKGQKIIDSNVGNGNSNIGYPGSSEEIEAFGNILKTSAQKMTGDELKAILEYLTQNAPKS